MNYLIVSPAFPPFSGVGSMRAYSLANYLYNKSNNVYIIRNTAECWGKENCKSQCNEFTDIIDVTVTNNFSEDANIYFNVIMTCIKKNRIDCIVYSCSPYYIAKTAIMVKKILPIPTVIDYRDLWINDEALTRNILKIWLKFIKKIPYRLLEKESIETADLVLTVTPKDCEFLRNKYKSYSKKIECVLNGYDETRAKESYNSDIVRMLPKRYLAVFGKFGYYDLKYATQLLEGLREYSLSNENLRIVHIGKLDKTTRKAIKKAKIGKDLYINLGYQDYSTGIEIIKHSFANCLIAHYYRGLGTKIYDYILANKPVIYYAPRDSSIDEILSCAEYSYRCNSARDTYDALKDIRNNEADNLGFPNVEVYSRESRNSEYEKLMIKIIQK